MGGGPTLHQHSGTENCVKGQSRGLFTITAMTPNTCFFHRIQRVNIMAKLPQPIMIMFAKAHLGWANDLQEQFRRNGKVVDREVNQAVAAIFKARRGVPLEEDKLEIFKACEEMENEEEGEGGWKLIPSPLIDVTMKVKQRKVKQGERSVAKGRAEATIDCTAEQAAAWLYDYNSRENLRSNRELKSSLAGVVVENSDPAEVGSREGARTG